MIVRDLGDVERITAGAVGEPGRRTFYLQMLARDGVYSLVVEKEQVQLLSTSVLEILANVEAETGGTFDEAAMALVEPVEPRWRVGRISIRYDEREDRIVLEVDEFRREAELEGLDEDEDDDDDLEELEPDEEDVDDDVAEEVRVLEAILGTPPEEEAERIVARATREQMLALSRHGAAVVTRGRPTCQFCANPIDPDGHVCPAMNGHGKH
ncbi:MAG: DUF3090 family protein [Actinomycetota bacterium]